MTTTRSQQKISRSKVGRPPAGDGGERVTDYPQVSFRLPKETRDKLRVLSGVQQQPQWRVIVEAVDALYTKRTETISGRKSAREARR